ncbi:MAG: hypothetical protein AB8I08_35005 [Sandaracinaceae bacterium]
MSAPIHLVRAKIDEARARGELDTPRSDEARVLSEMEGLLAQLANAEGKDALQLRAQLSVKERVLASILERTGQSVLAGALWDPMASVPVYDFA